MPYITQMERHRFDEALVKIPEIKTKGQLEYLIFWMQKKYMSTRTTQYHTLHDTAYAATHCGDEFRRRYLDQREDLAEQKNGDVICI